MQDARQLRCHVVSTVADALGWLLAKSIAKPLKAKPEADAMQEFLLAVNGARAVDFTECQEDRMPESEIVAARGYYYAPGLNGLPPPPGGQRPVILDGSSLQSSSRGRALRTRPRAKALPNWSM